ncbi:poly-gamma-glutamate hydrolase family protein (plasmid) [Streptomyces globisporus]|uniref:poly-gamma-glutamate hydrolase family protein n=1 Tax=Streptomyces globisporus TaxID=1908 RepID=UPI002F90BDDC|nr:poly-gamma-glutamate hydrolase family protein [Streptomyces globisporus]
MSDTYTNYADLAAHNILGTDYLISSRVMAGARGASIAVHGGAIEYPTTQLAEYCAGRLGASFYSLQGIKGSGNSSLHITSNRFDEPRALHVLRTAEWTVSWHGTCDSTATTYLGGLDTELGAAIEECLAAAGFAVSPPPQEIDGKDTRNIANRNLRGQGVQLELSRGLRESFQLGDALTLAPIASASRPSEVFYTYVSAVTAAIAETWPQCRTGSSPRSNSAT